MEYKKDAVYRQLREAIRSGQYPAGMRLPKESEFAAELGCALVTLRSALERLENEGVISRLRGQGTFVNRKTAPEGCKEIAVVFPNPDRIGPQSAAYNTFNRDLMMGVGDRAQAAGLTAVPISMLELDQLKSTRFKGVIWDRISADAVDTMRQLQASGIQQVLVNRHVDGIPETGANYAESLTETIQALRRFGHRHIGLADFDSDWPVFKNRREVFLRLMRLSGILQPEEYLMPLVWQKEPEMLELQAIEIANRLCRQPKLTAVIVSGVFIYPFDRAVHHLGISVPRDLSVIQWGERDGFEATSSAPYAIMTEPRIEIGRRAVELLLRGASGEDVAESVELLRGNLILRRGVSLPSDTVEQNSTKTPVCENS